jgi:hypothetical protein
MLVHFVSSFREIVKGTRHTTAKEPALLKLSQQTLKVRSNEFKFLKYFTKHFDNK